MKLRYAAQDASLVCFVEQTIVKEVSAQTESNCPFERQLQGKKSSEITPEVRDQQRVSAQAANTHKRLSPSLL
jgi:hypothetical protein